MIFFSVPTEETVFDKGTAAVAALNKARSRGIGWRCTLHVMRQ